MASSSVYLFAAAGAPAPAAAHWNDADVFIGCNPHCSSTHLTVGTRLFAGPLIAVGLLVLAWVFRDRAD